jgi:DNA-binding XRE family transcriptional regulator
LGQHIWKRRLELGMSQNKTAKTLEVTAQTLLHWEKGQTVPLVQFIPSIIRFLGYDPNPPAPATLAERLRSRRRELGWSKAIAARALGVDPATWSNWEKDGTILVKAHRQLVARFVGLSEADID